MVASATHLFPSNLRVQSYDIVSCGHVCSAACYSPEVGVQVGFSYSNTSADYNDNSDRQTATDNLRFLLAFLLKFPRYVGRPLYLSGESYAGYYVPLLANRILTQGGVQAGLNLKGVLIGNGLTDQSFDALSTFTVLRDRYFLAEEAYATLVRLCNASASALYSAACEDAKISAYVSVVSYCCATGRFRDRKRLTPSASLPLFVCRARWTCTVSFPLPPALRREVSGECGGVQMCLHPPAPTTLQTLPRAVRI